MSASKFTLCPACFKADLRQNCPSCGFDPRTYRHADASLPPGTSLGFYMVGMPRGQGGFGITYVGYDARRDRRVAVKEYFPSYMVTRRVGEETPVFAPPLKAEYLSGLRGFLAEAHILRRFNDHDGIVHVLDIFEANGTAYMVMEYLSGWTLGRQVLGHGPLPPDQAVSAMLHVMDGLRAVHGAGLIHRDVKPDNIFITRENQVKLIDFGAARHAAAGRSHQLTSVLSEPFAPFEQYQSNGVQGPWTDVYATGATLYFLLTRHLPNRGPDRLGNDPLVSPSRLNANIPSALEQVVLQSMAVQPDRRFQSMDEMQRAIRQAIPQAVRVRPVEVSADRQTISTPQPAVADPLPVSVVPANLSKRAGGLVLDIFLVMLVFSVDYAMSGNGLLTLLFSTLYFAVMQGSNTGSTFGMRATGIRLVRDNGSPVSFGRALLRFAMFTLLCFISIPSTLFNVQRRGLHDLAAGTVVVSAENS